MRNKNSSIYEKVYPTLLGVAITVPGRESFFAYDVEFLRSMGRKNSQVVDEDHPIVEGFTTLIGVEKGTKEYDDAVTALIKTDRVINESMFETFVSMMREVPEDQSISFTSIYTDEDAPEDYGSYCRRVALTGMQLRNAIFTLKEYQPVKYA